MKKKLLPISWTDGVNPDQAGKDTPHVDTLAANRARYEKYHVPAPKKRFRVYMRDNRRDLVNISIKRDLTYEEYLDIWEKVQDKIVERQENE